MLVVGVGGVGVVIRMIYEGYGRSAACAYIDGVGTTHGI